MKLIAILLLCLLAVSTTGQIVEGIIKAEVTPVEVQGTKEALQVVGGILVGAFAYKNSVATCFHDAEYIFQHFESAYNNLRHETHTTVKNGLMDLGRSLAKLPEAIKACKDIQNVILKIRHLAIVFSNPTILAVDVGKNIIWHGISIIKEVRSAVGHWNAHSYYNFGVNIGYICQLVFLKIEEFEAGLVNEGAQFLQGFAHGLNPSVYEDSKQCIGDISTTTLDQITRDVKDLDWKHISRSVEDIEDIVKIFVNVVKDCKTGSKAFTTFVVAFIQKMNASNFIEAALKIIKNPLKFARMVSNVHGDFKKHDLFDAGDVLGDFVGEVLSLHYTPVEDLFSESM